MFDGGTRRAGDLVGRPGGGPGWTLSSGGIRRRGCLGGRRGGGAIPGRTGVAGELGGGAIPRVPIGDGLP